EQLLVVAYAVRARLTRFFLSDTHRRPLANRRRPPHLSGAALRIIWVRGVPCQRTLSPGDISMSGPFGATSTTEDVLAGVDLSGKRVLVTGVSAGLGVETARALAAHGAAVVGAARDLAKAKRATSEAGVAKDGGSLELIELDLANLASARAAADALK